MNFIKECLLLLGVIGCCYIQHTSAGSNGPNTEGHGGHGKGLVSRSTGMRVEFKIAEELPRNTFVGQIPTKPGFTYRFNEQLDEFILNGTTGEIKTGKPIDRENLTSNHFDLVILSSQPVYPVEVRVTILDVNEFAPSFPEPEIEVTFSESANPGTRVFLDTATDPDSGTNGVTSEYKIVSGNEDEHFRLAVTPNPSGEAPFLHLETTGKLDREAIASYRLNISTQDGGSPPKLGFLIVNVVVLDINNNPPIFDHSDYVVSLNESAAMGTNVLQVRATDSDEGDNAKVTYYLSPNERQFSIDPETGDIFTMQQPLVCPKTCSQNHQSCSKSCVFTVFAHDHGVPRQDGRTYVTVNLIDTNDHAPFIKFTYFPPTASSASVDENAQNGSVVAAISIVDLDEGLNGETTVDIITGNELSHFRLESTLSFQLLRVNKVLDREKIGRYNLTIVATDKGSPSRSSTAFLVIQVNDINDHLPIFEKTEYSAVLRELTPIGTFVASITASDEDTGINAQVYYSIVSGNENMWFHIDDSTGLLTTINNLDREVQDTVRLKIAARDGGPNPKWAQTQIKITILDENERPEFQTKLINVTISEAALPGTVITKMRAIDNDQGRNGSVTYFFSKEFQSSDSEMFHLDSNSGQLSTKSSLDRESKSFYKIVIVAKDQGSPSLSTSATVQLTLSDVNDNPPILYPTNFVVPLSRAKSAIGQNVVQIQATDLDVGVNAKLQYYFTEETSNDDLLQRYFEIDKDTGHIRLKQTVHSLDKTVVELRVGVRDGGRMQAAENALVKIFIKKGQQEDDRKADGIFTESNYNFHISEHAGSLNGLPSTEPLEVGRIRVEVEESALSFQILDGDDKKIFEIDEETGVIQAIRTLDREAKSLYKLTVVGFLENDVYGLCTVNIFVDNINDCSPTFTKKQARITLPANTAVGSEVYLAEAIDLDNHQINYSLATNQEAMFTINSSNGIVSLMKPLRYSKSKSNELLVQIQASDNGQPPLSSQQTIYFVVQGVNEHTPVFDHSSYETSIPESTAVNLRFFSLQASDEDDEENGQIHYEIIEGNELDKFGIFPDGQLYVKSELDREQQADFLLTVMAKDNGNISRSSTVPLVIYIIDENDNKPQFQGNEPGTKTKDSADESQELVASRDFTNKTFVFFLDENDLADSYVGRVFATDLDEGPNAELTYSIPTAQHDFAIDSKNGFIRSLRSFDREHLIRTTGHTFISYQVLVQDNGVVRLKDTAQLVVWIQDVNDNRPVFLKKFYTAQVSESSEIGAQIIRVLATDEDEGLNGDILYYFGSKTSEEERRLFKLDSATGQITLTGHLDRESAAEYTITIVAQDMSLQKPLNSTTIVTIVVTDENDNSPTFAQSEAFISVLETTSVNTELIRFQASDPDLGPNKQVFYSISGGNRHDFFRIDIKSGSLYLNRQLDYERQTVHVLNITASDGGSPRLSTSLEFKVFVLDYNDMRPLFPPTAIVRQIVEGIPINSPIVTVTAEDSDSGVNGEVTYSILSQEPLGSHFAIHSNSGLIYTTAEIDREEIDAFRLVVQATDQAEPASIRLSSEKMVTVIVEDLNDNEPNFVSMNAALISQNMTSSDEIIRVHAIDLDSESNGIVTYEIVHGDSSLFKLDRSTGSLTLTHQVLNLQPRYQLAIRATDEAARSNRKSSEVSLTLLGASEPANTCNQLVFENTAYKGAIAENEAIGTSVLTVKSVVSPTMRKHFSDRIDNVDIEYYVTNVFSKSGEKQSKLFDIDLKRGVITSSTVLDHEMGVYIFDVELYSILLSSKGVFTCKTKVEIEVLDQADRPPQFKWRERKLELFENTRIGQEIITLVATDEDANSEVTYHIVQGNSGKFSLDSKTGTLRVLDVLDREAQEAYHLIIQASDGTQSSNMSLLIQLTDANDNEPSWDKSTYSFDVPEDAAQGYRVGQTVKATDPDKGINGALTYSVISDWGNDLFSVNSQTGVFTLTGNLDYEEVQHYIFVVQAQDGGNPSLSSTAIVYVNVQDLNDNSPEFSINSQDNSPFNSAIFNPMSYSKEVYENITIGSPVLTVTATDKDSGLNGKINYAIIAGNDDDLFEISDIGTISTKMPLDRETKPSHTLMVLASDEGMPDQLSSSVQVVITLRDVNDAVPQFVSENETFVMENAALNTVVLVVKASDADEVGRNTYIEYSLNNERNTFALGSTDGLLRVNGIIDRESRQNYTLKITARDRGEPPLSSSQNLFIRVVDTNDNAPAFDPKHYSAVIPENASLGMSVLQVSATDVDEGPNSQVHYSIVTGDPNRDFSIGEDSGVIRVTKRLNFERKRSYTLTINAEDSGTQILHDTATVTINVQNINDSPPKFLHSPYVVYVRENIATIPSTILYVTAHDADSGSQIRYLMKDGDKGSFRINASTGEVSVNRVLDREEQAEYVLTVVAMDTDTPRLSGTGIIRIVVEDANDNIPEFPHDKYEFLVEENTPVGTVISQIIADDLDDGLNARIIYKFLNDGPFEVDESSGVIRVVQKIDREVQEVYNLVLEAKDSNPIVQHASRTNVTIRILDVNDNNPVWSPKFRDNFTVTVPDDLSIGSYVVGVSAADNDVGLNGLVKYSLGGLDGDKFQINQNTGVVKSLTNLKPIHRLYQVEIHATDSSPKDPLSAITFINVKVARSKLFPKIKPGKKEFSFSENVRNAYVPTVEVHASNEGIQTEANLNFYIGGGNLGNAFEIGRRTGQIKITNVGLDYEVTHEYELWIEVCPDEEPELCSSTSLIITVQDANDNAPQLISKKDLDTGSDYTHYHRSIFEVSVPEEEPVPKLITVLQAIDQDSGENGRVKFRLSTDSSKAYGNIFRVNSDSGELYANTKFDREEISQYTLAIEAYDLGKPSLTGTASLIVTVSDINDHPPRFTRLFSANVTENVPMGTFVIQVTSVDKDVGENAKCNYSLVENPNHQFKIDSISGIITVNGMLDRESQDEYLLRVIANDGSWRAETLVSITIQDVNDNSPVYDYSFYSFNVPEHDQPISFVGQVTAADRDKRGPNSIVSYSLKKSSNFFTIDPVTGEIFSKKPLKYKTSGKRKSPENEFNLIVVASDSGKSSMSSECSVRINIIHKKNHAPVLEEESYFRSVPDTLTSRTNILQIKATDDLDYGINAELEFIEAGGNGSRYFTVDRESGWIRAKEGVTLTKENRLQQYSLKVEVKDKGIPPQGAHVSVNFIVVGPNNFAPVFSALSYRVIVPENEALGSVIVTVSAVDQDEGPNGVVHYNITSGNEAGKFSIDSATGDVTISQELDCDTVSEYQLNITAYDSGYNSLQSLAQLSIIVTDVNDNAPTFEKLVYEGFVKENAHVNTKVLQLTAHDIDSPKFSVVHYSIVGGNGRNLFSIDKLTGIITSKQSFDYEDKNKYNLEVLAANPDSNLFCSTQVEIHVEGVNEFVPKFIQPAFHFSVSEAVPIGSSIGMVQATDDDQGDDGTVYYLFIGSSNDGGFTINPITGILTVATFLDRETQSRVVLSVLAKNAGSIRGNDTDEAQVIVTIQDGNDPPVFENQVYQSEVKEDVSIGWYIGSVKAHDIDVKPNNNRFTYKILSGNENQTFKIDPHTGSIHTVRELDRESCDLYRLTIGAIDVGDPPQTGTTLMNIRVQDVQDSGPALKETSLHGSVFENEPPNTKVMTLEATDPDANPNGGPFKFAIVGGIHKEKFKVNKHDNSIYTTTTLDRESLPQDIILTIQIEDSGTPPWKTLQEVTVSVQDVNDSPSQPRNSPMLLYVFRGMLPSNEIANVQPLDPDAVGQYKCHLESAEDVFTIPKSCDMFLGRWPHGKTKHSVKVFGDDGQHDQVESNINVELLTFDNKTLENSIVIRMLNTSASSLMGKSYLPIRSFLRQIFQLQPHIYAIIPAAPGDESEQVDIIMAVGSGNNYENPENIARTLQNHKTHLEALSGSKIVINYSPCLVENTCLNGASCTHHLRAYPLQRSSDSSLVILSSPTVKVEFSCVCSRGFTGPQCELRKEPCTPNPCENSAPCVKQGLGFQCICPPNKQGKHCELDKHRICDPNPCDNGGSCQLEQSNAPNEKAYFCLCRPGFYGSHCQTFMDACKPNPCQNGGECEAGPNSLSSGYPVCKCSGQFYGRYCEKSGLGFGFASFMRFPSLDSNTDDISLIFSTNKEDSLLIYNFGEQIGGRSDFIAIELIHGKVAFSFGGARTAIASVSVDKYVADGGWHRVVAIRNGKLISLSVSDCEESGDHCQECALNDPLCYASNQGFTGTLNFLTDSLYIGGVKSVTALVDRPGQIKTHDFVGCIHSIEINGRTLNLFLPIESRFVSDTCQRVANVCQDKCGPSAECIDMWDTHTCNCDGGFHSMNCADAIAPYTMSPGSSIEFKIGEKYRRHQVLRNINTQGFGHSKSVNHGNGEESLALSVRTVATDGLLLYAATNKDYTLLELEAGTLKFSSKVGSNHVVVMNLIEVQLNDGFWHDIKLNLKSTAIEVYIDNERRGEELNAISAHNFLDPFLTTLVIGDILADSLTSQNRIPSGFDGCVANLSINGEIQPLNGSGSLLDSAILYGKITMGCSSPIAGTISAPDPLSIGVTLVIVFFIILLVAILVSFGVFHLRKREKSPLPSVSSGGPIGIKLNSTGSLQSDVVRNHPLMETHPNALRNFVHNSKKMSDNLVGSYSNKPDVILERSNNMSPSHHVTSRSMQNSHSSSMFNSPMGAHNMNQLPNMVSMEPDIADTPEHYDIENASSIAPSDIDIVYHYKGFRDNIRLPSRNRSSPFHHSHNFPGSSSQRQSLSNLKSTPLARLSPSSELSRQTPRILTLQDISGKPLQSALLAVSPKDAMTPSERSLNVSQSSTRSSLTSPSMHGAKKKKKKRRKCSSSGNEGEGCVSGGSMIIGLTAEEIDRLNNARHKNDSSIVSTLDAVSSSERDDDDDVNNLRRRKLNASNLKTRRSSQLASHDTSSEAEDGESVNDSFTCSEFEYDSNMCSSKRNFTPPNHSAFPKLDRGAAGNCERSNNVNPDGSYHGSLSTLVASDDDLAYINSFTKRLNANQQGSGHIGAAAEASHSHSHVEGWNYLLNWGPNYTPLANVFKDIADLPECSNDGGTHNSGSNHNQQHTPGNFSGVPSAIPRTSRHPPPPPRPSEEYV